MFYSIPYIFPGLVLNICVFIIHLRPVVCFLFVCFKSMCVQNVYRKVQCAMCIGRRGGRGGGGILDVDLVGEGGGGCGHVVSMSMCEVGGGLSVSVCGEWL